MNVKRIYITHRDLVIFTILALVGVALALPHLHTPKPLLSCVESVQQLNVVADIANRTGRLPGDPVGHEGIFKVNPTIVDRCFQ